MHIVVGAGSFFTSTASKKNKNLKAQYRGVLKADTF